jgi:hypothetical protein
MKHKVINSDLSIDKIATAIHTRFPELQLSWRKNFAGTYLVVGKTNVIGAAIKIKGDTIIMRDAIPSLKLAFLIGSFGLAGLAIARYTRRKEWNTFHSKIHNFIKESF